MEQIYKDRLLKLAAHLETGKLGHKIFNFDIINDIWEPKCGTQGCALGELPIVFPDRWKFSSRGSVLMSAPSDVESDICTFFSLSGVESDICTFFWLSDEEYMLLFTPCEQYKKRPEWLPDPYMPWYKVTGSKAKKEEVAANIRRFVAWKEENSGQKS